MQKELFIESTDTEDDLSMIFDPLVQEVSISSIKTQDSIENNSMVLNLDEEDYKETEVEFRTTDIKHRAHLIPFLSFKETQQSILSTLSAPRIRIEIKPLSQILKNLHSVSESFQVWKKQD